MVTNGSTFLSIVASRSLATAKLIDEARADWIFCPGGLTTVDRCEDHRDEAFLVNCEAPARAVQAASYFSMIQVSASACARHSCQAGSAIIASI